MSGKFTPVYSITPEIAKLLMQIESMRERASCLPFSSRVLSSLRETAKLYTTHYSTMIEGNQLTLEQVKNVVLLEGHFPGREREEHEVKGYYAALAKLEQTVLLHQLLTEEIVQTFHALVMSGGRENVKPTPYRDGQNVIKDGATKQIVYLPPEAQDVPALMHQLITWIGKNKDLPCPLVAAIAHYQFATIHPYYDGNGRTARLLTTLILHLGGFDLKGLYSLEEYYAKDLLSYYKAISIGPSHNYYLGRAEADITEWILYFCRGMAHSFEKVIEQMEQADVRGERDLLPLLRLLDAKQRKALEIFKNQNTLTSQDLIELFGFKQRTCINLCKKWVDHGFLVISDPSKKGRKYQLAPRFKPLLGCD